MTYGTNVTTKRLGKRVQQATKSTVTKHKDHVKEAEEESKLRETMRSLQIAHDPRYKTIEHYKDCDSTRLESIVGGSAGGVPRMYPEPWGMPEPVGRRSLYHAPAIEDEERDAKKLAEGECAGFKDMTLERFEGRIGWEESFKSNVKQLMVDFNLSNNPGCRLNHLDRMHHWFAKEGKKQTKKETLSPNFLTFEKNARPLPGSVRDVPQPVDNLTLDLAGILKTPAKRRVEQHFGVVPGGGRQASPPMGGYK